MDRDGKQMNARALSAVERNPPSEYLEGAAEIAAFLTRELGGTHWTARKVRHARDTGALPIRQKPGIGLYAFGSELIEALKAPETLPNPETLTRAAG